MSFSHEQILYLKNYATKGEIFVQKKGKKKTNSHEYFTPVTFTLI